MRITEEQLTKKQRVELVYIVHFDTRPFIQKRGRIILDKAEVHRSKYRLTYSLISTMPRLFEDSLSDSGNILRIMSQLTNFSTLSIVDSLGWGPPIL